MPVVRRYEFDTSFDPPDKPGRGRPAPPPPPPPPPPPAPPPPPPEPTFSRAELAAARAEGEAKGRQEGEAAGRREAMATIEQRLAAATERLTQDLAALAATQAQELRQVEAQAAAVTLTVIRKLYPALAERAGFAEIEAIVTETFEHVVDEPRVIIRCGESLKEALDPLAQRAAAAAGFEGRLMLIGDPRLGPEDCRLEWADGGIEREPGKILKTVEAIVASGLAAFDQHQGATAPTGSGKE